jgi:hypothetical protein
MSRAFSKLVFIAVALVMVSAFTTQKAPPASSSQPPEERAAQDALPQSHDPIWTTLLHTKIHVNEKRGLYSATYPPDVKALDGKQITITGFMLPVETTETFKHFILAKRTPTCPFCPPGEPNEIVDVWLDKKIDYSEKLLTITGTFGFMNNQQFGMFFKLTHAALK